MTAVADPRIDAYARAVLGIAQAEGRLAEVEDELFRFARVIEGNDDLRMALANPGLPLDRRAAIVEELLDHHFRARSAEALLAHDVVDRCERFDCMFGRDAGGDAAAGDSYPADSRFAAIADPTHVGFDPEPTREKYRVIDWDAVEQERNQAVCLNRPRKRLA